MLIKRPPRGVHPWRPIRSILKNTMVISTTGD
jgi:hypothetical protein